MALLMITGCKAKKQVAESATIASDNIAVLVKNIQMAEPAFRTANFSKLNMSFAYDTRKLNNISASCRMISDTAIYVSIQPVFGIELFSVEITPDSITIIDKMNRRFFTATYQYIFQKTGVPLIYENIQAMLANSLFSVGEKEINPLKLKTGKTPEGKRSISFISGKLHQETIINGNNEIERINLASSDGRNRISVNYEQNQLWVTTRYPKKVTVTGSMNKLNFNSEIEINRVVFNAPVSLSPANKANLMRGNIEQILSK